MPVGVLLVRRRIDMHMVGYIVKNHIDIVLVRCSQQGAELLVCTETNIQLRGEDGPITVVTAELRVGLARVVLIAVLELITTPTIPGVLSNRGYPNRVDTQTVEEALFNLLGYTGKVTTLVVHDIQYLRRAHFPVVVRVAVRETVYHQRVEHLSFRVVTGELFGIYHGFTVLKRNK